MVTLKCAAVAVHGTVSSHGIQQSKSNSVFGGSARGINGCLDRKDVIDLSSNHKDQRQESGLQDQKKALIIPFSSFIHSPFQQTNPLALL